MLTRFSPRPMSQVFSPDGFTLTEVLMAMVVFAIGLLGLSAMTLAMGRSLTLSKNVTIATTLGQETMEGLKQTSYVQVVATNYPVEPYNTIAGYPQFQREVSITPDSPFAEAKTIRVRVLWPRLGRPESPHAVTLTTVVTKQP